MFTDGYLGDVSAMAKGQARFDPPSRSSDEFSTVLTSLSPILPMSAEQIRDLAVNQALIHDGIRVHPPSADAAWSTTFDVKDGGLYTVYAHGALTALCQGGASDGRNRRNLPFAERVRRRVDRLR